MTAILEKSTPAEEKTKHRWDHWVLFAGILFVVLAPRLIFLNLIKDDPAFQMPIIDNLEFDDWARRIHSGQILWTDIENHTPLYAYFVALFYTLFGYGVVKVALAQYLLAGLGGFLLYRIAERLTGRAAAVVACLFYSTYWFMIYVQSFIFCENLSIVLNLLLIYVLLFFRENKRKFFLAGMILGLSSLSRPESLAFSIIMAIYFAGLRPLGRKAVASYGLFLAGTLLFLAPLLWYNYRLTGDFPMLRSQTGANFYMGIHPDFKGTSVFVPIGQDWENFILQPSKDLGRQASLAEEDQYFFGKSFEYIRTYPGQWSGFMGRKILSVLTGSDFLRPEDLYFYGQYMDRTPFVAVSTRLIFLLAIMGFFLSSQEPRRWFVVYLFVGAAGVILLFQIKTRYLMPAIPFVVLWAAHAVTRLYDAFIRKRWGRAMAMIAGLCLLKVISLYNPLSLSLPDLWEIPYANAKNYIRRGMPQQAIEQLKLALALEPKSLSAYNELGIIHMNLGHYERALLYFKKAISLDPEAPKPRLNYELCQRHIQEGNPRGR